MPNRRDAQPVSFLETLITWALGGAAFLIFLRIMLLVIAAPFQMWDTHRVGSILVFTIYGLLLFKFLIRPIFFPNADERKAEGR